MRHRFKDKMASNYACVSLILFGMIFLAQARNAKAGKVKEHDGQVSGGCASLAIPATPQSIPTITIPPRKWMQIPSIKKISDGHYQALGRVIHMKYLKTQLRTQKNFDFTATRKTMNLVQRLDILADTLYVEETVALTGIGNVKIYAREIFSATGSKIFVSAPNWDQKFSTAVAQTGQNGDDGKHGEPGPQVDIFCDVINGVLDVTSKAGNGHKGQVGGKGARAADRSDTQPTLDTTWLLSPEEKKEIGRELGWYAGYCSDQAHLCKCDDVTGRQGRKGRKGGTGGDAGRPGNGGNAGSVNIRYNTLNGQVQLKSCRGTGAPPVANGAGGEGGAGGRGGLGRDCLKDVVSETDDKESRGGTSRPGEKRSNRVKYPLTQCKEPFFCKDDGVGGENTRGKEGLAGDTGDPGTTPNTPGSDGSVTASVVQSGTLDATSKQTFPVDLLVIMRRQAEDLLLSNSDSQKGREALQFVFSVASEISGDEKAERIKKYAKRKLGFLDKTGYDIFGNNELFAPRIKWEVLEGTVEDVKDAAEKYENAFNDMISAQKDAENIQELGSKISEVSSQQMNAEKERLEQAQYIAESEKRLYIKGIKYEEETMAGIVQSLDDKLTGVYQKGKFNKQDFLAVLQGVVGFFTAIKDGNPSDFINNALDMASGPLAGKQCLKSLDQYKNSIKKWLTFGEHYKPYEDSSQLDFDQLDVGSIPEIMQTNLEMNKEKFTSELVCLLDVASLPQDVADFNAEVESFFTAGENRISLIGKVMDLDNDIGGYMFDIPLLEKTEKTIAEVGQPPDCRKALGMENGEITDRQISASSEYDENHAAVQGRLNFLKSGDKEGAWSAKTSDANQYLQIDLGNEVTKVTRVASQGRNGYSVSGGQWVRTYKLKYSNDEVNFQYYREEGEDTDKEFAGNTDQDTVVDHELTPPIKARYIRFEPVAWNNHVSMRVEVYGCQDIPLITNLKQNFMDFLISTYRALERSFMRNLYELHKAFMFRTLWEGNNPLASFRRVASESAYGTGRLNGAVQLTGVLRNMKVVQEKAVKCFTNNIYTTGMKKWHFNIRKNKRMFQQLAQGYTRFALNIDKSCTTCYNIRMLKIYIELFGGKNDPPQPENVPAVVHLKVRHLSASYFRAGTKEDVDNEEEEEEEEGGGEKEDNIKQYRQPIGSYRDIKFDRFAVTKEKKCQQSKEKGRVCTLYCLTEEDSRWHEMCNHQLNNRGSSNQDRLMGMEECKSPFGIYELKIPVDNTLECDDDRITHTNCKDLELNKFTQINVWTYFYYWTDHYPTGPDDRLCKVPSS